MSYIAHHNITSNANWYYYKSTMDGNASCSVYQCPKCGNKDFQLSHAVLIHLHTCKALFAPLMNETTQKRTYVQITLAHYAEQIFQSMKRLHTSGHHPNVDRLSVNFTCPMVESVLTNVDNGYTDAHTWCGGDNYGNASEFSIKCDNSMVNEHSITSSTKRCQFHQDLNPPPGVKKGVDQNTNRIVQSWWFRTTVASSHIVW